MKLRIVITALLCCACYSGEEVAQIKSGAAEVRVWYKTPTQIANTVKQAWEMRIDPNEEHNYITALGPFYGGVDKLLMKATLERPTSGYVLALDVVSAWLSRKLIDAEEQDRGFLFSGGVNTREQPQAGHSCNEFADHYCYTMDSVAWCDCVDGVELGRYNSKTALTLEDRKRLMHNIQDIGDFFNIAIDNKLYIDAAQSMHAAQYLLAKVFIPNLGPPEGVAAPHQDDGMETQTINENGEVVTAARMLASDHEAWVKVVYTIMMSGPFYINLQMVEGK